LHIAFQHFSLGFSEYAHLKTYKTHAGSDTSTGWTDELVHYQGRGAGDGDGNVYETAEYLIPVQETGAGTRGIFVDTLNKNWLRIIGHMKNTGGGTGGANVTTDTVAPTSPSDGDLWFDESVGKLYVYIDGTGWVQTNGGGSGGGGVFSTGWSTSIPSADSDVTYTHNLGTDDILYKVYVRDSSGNEHDVTSAEIWSGVVQANSTCVNITTTQITIRFLSKYLDWTTAVTGVNPAGLDWSTATHIKVVVSSGSGSGGGTGGGGSTITFIDKVSTGQVTYGAWTTVPANSAWSGANSLIVHADSRDIDTGGNSSIELKVRASSSQSTEVLVIDHNQAKRWQADHSRASFYSGCRRWLISIPYNKE
jgi:hypothetical protein